VGGTLARKIPAQRVSATKRAYTNLSCAREVQACGHDSRGFINGGVQFAVSRRKIRRMKWSGTQCAWVTAGGARSMTNRVATKCW